MTQRIRLCVGTLVLSFALPCAAWGQGAPPPPPPPLPAQGRDSGPQKTGTARLSGRVTSLDTGRPIRRAVIRASSAEVREGKAVSTDGDGRWALRDLPPGRYTLFVTKAGYINLFYGQKRPFEAGKTIDLADAQSIGNVDFSLPRGSAVTGRVVDEFGDPVLGARVSAMRFRYQGGVRRLFNAGSTDTTDDLGQYRLHGLAPGEYYISAQVSGVGFMSSTEDRTGYATTYFPGTLTPEEATRVSLTVGQEAQNIVVPMTPTKIATVSGTATDSSGKPIVNGMIFIRDRSGGGMQSATGMLRPDGTWSISGVTPGEYVATLQAMATSLEEVGATGTSVLTEAGSLPLTVTGDDIRGIALVTSRGGTAKGHFKFDTEPAPAAGAAFLMATESGDGTPATSSSARVRADWTFDLGGLNGRRLIRPSNLPKGWSLKAIMFQGNDVTDTGIDVKPGEEVSGLEVLLTQRTTEVSGVVQDAKNNPVTDYVVVIFPPERERWGWGTRFVRAARPDQTGRFTIPGLPPASYFAIALEYLEPGEETNPEFLDKLKAAATTVSVGEGEKKTLTLKLSSSR